MGLASKVLGFISQDYSDKQVVEEEVIHFQMVANRCCIKVLQLQ
jgi:hypothetical protein